MSERLAKALGVKPRRRRAVAHLKQDTKHFPELLETAPHLGFPSVLRINLRDAHHDPIVDYERLVVELRYVAAHFVKFYFKPAYPARAIQSQHVSTSDTSLVGVIALTL
jgi:hypothetical protein